ncbi:MAG: indole-3-glycerol phosphate synthase [Eubacteriaceae bacterium]|jgi:indole-3-glycerol phosphate synthase|nr:indole-3-glycerol phosphate synthase [Eubacteriaceae bacterium]MDK2904304.1 indole-3-glycerol phosphate synthase [Eubacteriaceae bacterium]MDK2936645.1 indole-3-glycerol phosphate synthase [Eubacteriaceae bacterium]MDK2960971.1 indole-3-glycerol phosphate synthase [Eubacteriaceae bacterium]MDN5306697.1 indole-3-glycerol phosphate synthase [Eubacteriaceae bacterium]
MILDKIVKSTKLRLEKLKSEKSLQEIKDQIKQKEDPFSFEKALRKNDLAFICEIKKASPSKGIIDDDFPFLEIARDYEKAGADAISVLTEPEYFKGSDDILRAVKQAVSIPLIRKDFTIDPYQIYEAALIGADAILLICAILSEESLKEYLEIADHLGLSALVETHDETEVRMALRAGARIIGVNNRDLKTFEVDINNSISLRQFVPEDILFVSESGIKTAEDISMLKENKTNAVLIGETLMRCKNKKQMLEQLKG